MNLIHVSTTGLYGRHTRDLEIRIDPVTVVTGPNESGKSTVLGAISLVLDGPSGSAWPILGDRPAYDWRAELVFDDGQGRQLAVSRGMYRGDHFVALDRNPVGPREARKMIETLVGSSFSWSAPTFMEESGKARLEWLLAKVVDGEGWDIDRVVAAVAAVAGEANPFPGSNWRAEPTGRQALDRLMADLRVGDLDADRECRRLTKVIEHDVATGPGTSLPPGTVASWMAERERVDKDLSEALQALGSAEGTEKTLQVLREEQDRLWAQIEALQNVDAARQRELDARTALGAASAEQSAAARRVEAAVARVEEVKAVLVRVEEALRVVHAALREAVKARATLEAAVAARAVYEPAIALLREFLSYVGASGDLNPARKVLHDKIGAVLAELDLASALPDVNPVTELDIRHNGAVQAQDAARREFGRAETAEKAARTNLASHSKAVEDARNAVHRAVEAIETRAVRLAELTDRYERVTAQVVGAGSSSLDALDAQVEALRAKRGDAQRNIDTLTDAAAGQADKLAHRAGLKDAQDRRGKLREVLKELERVRAEMAGALFAPLRERVSAFTEAVVGASWNIEANGVWDWALNRGEDGHGHGSQSLQVVALAALHVAVAEKLGGWRHVILDDLENLEPARREALVRALWLEVAAGRLDNALVACVGDWNFAPSPECGVVEMGARP